MEKTLKTLFAAIVIVATTTAFLTGCKKDNSTAAVGAPTANALAQGEATLAKIMDFKQQVEYYRAYPNVKDGATASIDEAIWNIEALFNFTYSYPDLSYGRTVTADTILYLPLQADNTVLLTDLTVFYGQMYEAVSAIYHSINLDSKQFLILDVEEGTPTGGCLPINLHSVQGTVKGTSLPIPEPQMWRGPFTRSPSWYYGENGGNDQSLEPMDIDAADTLSRMLNARLCPQAPNGYEYFYTNIRYKDSMTPTSFPFSHPWFPNLTSYCEFYRFNPSISDYWLDSDLMNFHYYGECHLVQEVFRNDDNPIPSTHSLFQVTVTDFKTNESIAPIIGHHTFACYGIRDVIGHEFVDRGSL